MAIDLGELFVRLTADMKQLSSGLQKAQTEVGNYAKRTDAILKNNARSFQRLGRQAQLAGLAITGALTVAAKKFGDFDKAMRRATAVSTVTMEQFVVMSELAERQSIALNTAATETAEAFYFLGSAGLSATQQLDAFIPTTNLAKAAVISMGEAAKILAGTVSSFALEFKDSKHVSDILAKTVVNAQTTFTELGEAISYVGGVAESTNNSLEDTSAILAAMANDLVTGSRAGTGLRMAMIRLAAPTGEVKRTLDQLGISVSNADGEIRPLLDILADLEIAFKDLTEVEQAHAVSALFGKRAIGGMLAVFKRGIGDVKRFSDGLTDSGETTKELTEKQMAAFSEQWGAVSREIAKLIRTIGKLLGPTLESLRDSISRVTKSLQEFADAFPETSRSIVEFTAVLGIALIAAGTLLTIVAKMAFVAIALKVSVAAVAGTFALAAAAIGVTAYNVIQLQKSFDRVANVIKNHIEQMQRVKELFKESADAIEEYQTAMETLGRDPAQMRSLEVFAHALEVARENMRNFQDQLTDFDRWGMEELRRVPYFRELDTIMVRLQTALDQAEKSYNNALERMKTTTTELNKEIEKTPEIIDKTGDAAFKLKEVFEGAASDIENAFEDAFVNITTDAENWRDHMNDMINDIYRSLTRQMFQLAVAKPLMGIAEDILGIAMPGLKLPLKTRIGVGGEETGATPVEMARGGIVRPVYAQRGFRPRGTDTVPAMLTPGEMIIPKSIVDLMRDGERESAGGPQGPTIIVKSIDSKDTFAFLRNNRRMIASMLDRSRSENHPNRRGGY